MTPKSAALIIGIIFIVVGLLGFIPNPIVGAENAMFHADTPHNLVHIISGVLFILVAIAAPANVSTVLKIFGAVYFLLGICGLFVLGDDGMGTVLGFLQVGGSKARSPYLSPRASESCSMAKEKRKIVEKEITWGGRHLSLETGKLAGQADSAADSRQAAARSGAGRPGLGRYVRADVRD